MRLYFAALDDNTTDATFFRSAFFNHYNSLGDPNGTTQEQEKYDAIKAHVIRVEADVIVLDETPSSDNAIGAQMAIEAGYSYSQYLDGGVGLGQYAFSKYPILEFQVLTNSYIQSKGYSDGLEMPSNTICSRVRIEKNSKTAIIYSLHLQFSNGWPIGNGNGGLGVPLPADEFARYIQLYRVFQDIADQKGLYPFAKIVLQGDFNDGILNTQTNVFTEIPSGMFSGFVAGSDVASLFPINYHQFPHDLIAANGIPLPDSEDLVGSIFTLWDNPPNPAFAPVDQAQFDFIGANVPLLGSEILNSESDANIGLPKNGNPLPFASSRQASDHKLVFCDLIM